VTAAHHVVVSPGLRGQDDKPLVIPAASEALRRLVGLLGWDTDPSVQVRA
jgi:hypothetical protein